MKSTSFSETHELDWYNTVDTLPAVNMAQPECVENRESDYVIICTSDGTITEGYYSYATQQWNESNAYQLFKPTEIIAWAPRVLPSWCKPYDRYTVHPKTEQDA
jgi:hypothetical protein